MFPFLTQFSDSACAGCVVADIFRSLFGGFCVFYAGGFAYFTSDSAAQNSDSADPSLATLVGL
jgi:hypothetical protein